MPCCDRGHTPYRQIGHRAVSYVMDRCGISYTQDEVQWLVSADREPEAVPGRARRRSHACVPRATSSSSCRTAIRDMLKAAGPHIGFPFDQVISVAEAGYFKPHWKTYAKAEELIGRGIARAACSWPTTPSTASAPSPTACARPSSTAASAPSARRRTSRPDRGKLRRTRRRHEALAAALTRKVVGSRLRLLSDTSSRAPHPLIPGRNEKPPAFSAMRQTCGPPKWAG